MIAPSQIHLFQGPARFCSLNSDQRTLVEHVSSSTFVAPAVRKRALALLLLDDGTPLPDIPLLASLPVPALRALVRRYADSGVRAALLQERAGGNEPVPARQGQCLGGAKAF